MRQIQRVLFLLAVIFILSPAAYAATYKIDPGHSAVGFKIRHLFSNVPGRFDRYEGAVEYDPKNPSSWAASATIQIASINTNAEARDQHLKSADFFDAEKFPVMTFKSTGVAGAAENGAKLNGDLTLHGVTKPVTLDLQIHGSGKDMQGKVRAGFTATAKINRKDFGVAWNKVMEGGGLVLGDEVDITIDVEAVEI